jgi:hypothetical protein
MAANDKLLSAPSDLASAAPAPPVVAFGTPVALPQHATQQRWVLPFSVNLMPQMAELTRYVSFKLGKTDWTLAYQLTSAPQPAASWALKPLPVPVRAISPTGVVALNISVVGTLPVTGLKLAPIEFIEQGNKRALAASQLTLCDTPAPCEERADISRHAPGGQIWLAPRLPKEGGNAPTMWPGKYEGIVTVASDDKPAGENANLTIYVTAWGWQAAGFALIVAGIIAAWYCTTFLRQRLAREQMLVPAVALRAALDGLARSIAHLQVPVPTVMHKLGELDLSLTDAELEQHGLPASVPQSSPNSGGAGDLDAFKHYLEIPGAWVGALQEIVRDGLQRLVQRRDAHVAANGELQAVPAKAFADSVAALDHLAGQPSVPDAAKLASDISTQIASFEATLGPIPMSAPGGATGGQLRSPEQLRMRIALGGMLAWGFIGTVTALAGLYVLILSNPGFGTPLDLLGCLLWGLGLPASTLLASATTNSIASTLNVSR